MPAQLHMRIGQAAPVVQARRMDIHTLYRVIFRWTRKRRMRCFESVLGPTADMRVLDIGGSPFNWQFVSAQPRVVLLNLSFAEEAAAPARFEYVSGDARALPYADGEFEIVHSNSVIEHVGDFAQQQRFAAESRRVARRLWVQTPARCFFIEPHYLTPFIHWLPKRWQKRLLRRCSVWGWLQRPTRGEIDEMVEQTRLLSRAELQRLYPDCEILTERFLLMPKSYIAVRRYPVKGESDK